MKTYIYTKKNHSHTLIKTQLSSIYRSFHNAIQKWYSSKKTPYETLYSPILIPIKHNFEDITKIEIHCGTSPWLKYNFHEHINLFHKSIRKWQPTKKAPYFISYG